jgi:hypothetical protein
MITDKLVYLKCWVSAISWAMQQCTTPSRKQILKKALYFGSPCNVTEANLEDVAASSLNSIFSVFAKADTAGPQHPPRRAK